MKRHVIRATLTLSLLCGFLTGTPVLAVDCDALLADDDKLMKLDTLIHEANDGKISMLTVREEVLIPALMMSSPAYDTKDALFLYDLSLASGWRLLNLVHLNVFFPWSVDDIAECLEKDATAHHPERAPAIALLRKTLR